MTEEVKQVKRKVNITLFPSGGGPVLYEDVTNVDTSKYNFIQFSNTLNGHTYHIKSNLRYIVAKATPKAEEAKNE